MNEQKKNRRQWKFATEMRKTMENMCRDSSQFLFNYEIMISEKSFAWKFMEIDENVVANPAILFYFIYKICFSTINWKSEENSQEIGTELYWGRFSKRKKHALLHKRGGEMSIFLPLPRVFYLSLLFYRLFYFRIFHCFTFFYPLTFLLFFS